MSRRIFCRNAFRRYLGVFVLAPVLFFAPSDAAQAEFYLGLWSDFMASSGDTNLAIWLDAANADSVTLNNGNVSQWADGRGNGVSVSQATANLQPAYNAAGNFVTFSGHRLTGTTRFGLAGNPDLMFLGVVEVLGNPAADIRISQIGGAQTGILAVAHGTDGWSWRHNNGNKRFEQATVNQQHLVAFTHAAGTDYGASLFHLDGTASGSTGVANSGTFPTSTTELFSLGAGQKGDGSWGSANVRVYEWVAVNSSSETDRQLLEGYLAHKWWGMNNPLPTDHPFKIPEPNSLILLAGVCLAGLLRRRRAGGTRAAVCQRTQHPHSSTPSPA